MPHWLLADCMSGPAWVAASHRDEALVANIAPIRRPHSLSGNRRPTTIVAGLLTAFLILTSQQVGFWRVS